MRVLSMYKIVHKIYMLKYRQNMVMFDSSIEVKIMKYSFDL
jgi:hypothetical protein